VAYGDLIFVPGSIGRDPQTGKIAVGNIVEQTRQTLKNIQAELEKAGVGLDNVVKVTIFITDMGLFAQMNEAYRLFFPQDPPARSCVEVSALPDKDALVEIEVISGR